MEFILHVYSSWKRRHSPAIKLAFSSPKWEASSLAMLSVERRVPYRSKAMIVLLFEAIMKSSSNNLNRTEVLTLRLVCLNNEIVERHRWGYLY